MSFNDFMNKVRQLDNMIARWLLRHFYFMFFQLVLLVIFVFWFGNLLNVIDLNYSTHEKTVAEKIHLTDSVNTTIIVILLLMNSFWMLYIFNSLQRLSNLLKDMSYNISRLRLKSKNEDQKYSS